MIDTHVLNRNGRVVCSPADVQVRSPDKRYGETTDHAETGVTIRQPTTIMRLMENACLRAKPQFWGLQG